MKEQQPAAPPPPLKNEVYTEEIIRFVFERGITRNEYFRAHEIALGVPEDDTELKGEVSQNVYDLAALLKQKFDERMSVTASAEIADELQHFANAPQQFHDLVASLHTSDNEKKVLTSIFERKRSGTLEVCAKGEEKPIVRIRVKPSLWENSLSPQRLMSTLLTELRPFKEGVLEITWSE